MGQKGRRSGVDVMNDKQAKLEEIETSLTLGGVGEGRFQGRGKWRGFRWYSTVKYTMIHES